MIISNDIDGVTNAVINEGVVISDGKQWNDW